MVKAASENGSSSVAPFLTKCYDMVQDPSTDSIIYWSQSNNSFIIDNVSKFSLTLLPNYFKHNNFSSFVRQLNIYGFRKIDTDNWEFANENFIRGQKHLLKNIRRRKHPHVADQQKALPQKTNSDEPSLEAINSNLWKEVENLKSDRKTLTQELVKHKQHLESSESKLLLLSDRLEGMEKHQQQMLSFLVMVVQCPGFLAQLLHPKENNWRFAEEGNMWDQSSQDDEPVPSDGAIIKYKPPVSETLRPVVPRSPAFEPEPELSADGLKDLCISSEFLKLLLDEKLSPLDNHSPFLVPDLPDDGSWEKLFLGSPFPENTEDTDHENERHNVSEMEMEPITETPNERSAFEAMIVEMEKTQA
ncbi:heat stress transcription factor A-8-like [Vicia villosa]|uniref:heat stress transcription factor A-8-like n=1 Tax=Vicia villosa TaxID=3911 RepID=UPI00273BCF19|nr:heat stress transcription factor A-8-like [Vicia villosa]